MKESKKNKVDNLKHGKRSILANVPPIEKKGELLTRNLSIQCNYDISFQLYEENYQKVKLKDLSPAQLKSFNNLILEVIKCKTYDEFSRINRGKTNPKKNTKLYEHKLKDKIIHIGKDGTKFRLHGLLYDTSFKILCIDPNHEVHRE